MYHRGDRLEEISFLLYGKPYGMKLQKTSETPTKVFELLYEKTENPFKKLFQDNDLGTQGFQESMHSFLKWWHQLIGGFAMERAVNDWSVKKLYSEISKRIVEYHREQTLTIDLVYDDFQWSDINSGSFYTVLPMKELVPYKKDNEQSLSKLLECIL